MSLDNYDIISIIGEGAFGKVTKVKRKSDNYIFVWKELNYGKMTEKEKQLLVSEVNILRDLNNPHIVRYHDRIISRENKIIYIVMEFCSGGDLASLIKIKIKEKKYFDEEFIWKVFAEVSIALYECHNKQGGKVLHRDLKPGNIFFDDKSNVKLGDFGLARVLQDTDVFAQTHVGTPYYMSPEQVSEKNYNEKSDIWSFGCLMYEMATLAPPFKAANHLALAVKIQSGKFQPLPDIYSKELNRVISCMIQTNDTKRPKIDDILMLPKIQLRYREVKLSMRYSALKSQEEELKKKEAEFESKVTNENNKLSEERLRLQNWENSLKELAAKYSNLPPIPPKIDKDLKQISSNMITISPKDQMAKENKAILANILSPRDQLNRDNRPVTSNTSNKDQSNKENIKEFNVEPSIGITLRNKNSPPTINSSSYTQGLYAPVLRDKTNVINTNFTRLGTKFEPITKEFSKEQTFARRIEMQLGHNKRASIS